MKARHAPQRFCEEKAKGARGNPGGQGAKIVPSHAASAQKPLSDLGISHTQSSRWQKLASIPEDQFEATFAKPDARPSTNGMDDRARWTQTP
jgi:hypothetical protein